MTRVSEEYGKKIENIIEMLDELNADVKVLLSKNPESIKWGHVGNLSQVEENLKNACRWSK